MRPDNGIAAAVPALVVSQRHFGRQQEQRVASISLQRFVALDRQTTDFGS
jgi:hypothetical protein